MKRVVVVGAGVGGLAAAALLARAGMDVTVLEAHVYPGGCAGTFYHQGYRFDAGATLPAGFYRGGPMDLVAQSVGIDSWPVRNAEPAMVVYLPDSTPVTRFGDDRRWQERRQAFGTGAEQFWRWQESTADALWDLALRLPHWPPQFAREATSLIGTGLGWLSADLHNRLRPTLALDMHRPVTAHLAGTSQRLRLFVDAQLLIAAQTTGDAANALYGAAALDLPRRGVVHAEGGMGTIARVLGEAVRRHGGRIHFRQEANCIAMDTHGRPTAVETRTGESFPSDLVIVNLPPWNVAQLVGHAASGRLRRLPPRPDGLWGAFMVYAGLDGAFLSPGLPLHHQVVMRRPDQTGAGRWIGEGNTVFLSLSPEWDAERAPTGGRALTISTHTDLASWWSLYEDDRSAYEVRKRAYTERVLDAAEVALPGLRDAAKLVLPATPVTFESFTRRVAGGVGGFPQTNLFRTWGPRLGSGLWMAGDSIFPGQSVPAVALGGLRVARDILAQLGLKTAGSEVFPGVGTADSRGDALST
jgi:C-3',4' desaturase CrtD